MTTEILGFLIILGAIIILLARRHLNKVEDDPEVLEAATGRLRYELEQSADEIIGRMTEHVNRLEKMLREADYKAELLQSRIEQLQMLQQQNVAVSNTPIANAAQPVTPKAEQIASIAEDILTQQPAVTVDISSQLDAALSSKDKQAWDYIREASMKLEAEYEAQSNTMQDKQQSDDLQQAVDIQAGNVENLVSSYVPSEAPADTPFVKTADADGGFDTEAAAVQARALLQQGYTVEEIAKATGLGIGAVHLIKQLLEKKM